MMGYMNERSRCCHTAVPGRMIGYVNGRSCCCHTAVLGGMMGYVNGRSCCCYIAVSGGALESGKRVQLTESRMRKGRLVGW